MHAAPVLSVAFPWGHGSLNDDENNNTGAWGPAGEAVGGGGMSSLKVSHPFLLWWHFSCRGTPLVRRCGTVRLATSLCSTPTPQPPEKKRWDYWAAPTTDEPPSNQRRHKSGNALMWRGPAQMFISSHWTVPVALSNKLRIPPTPVSTPSTLSLSTQPRSTFSSPRLT